MSYLYIMFKYRSNIMFDQSNLIINSCDTIKKKRKLEADCVTNNVT